MSQADEHRNGRGAAWALRVVEEAITLARRAHELTAHRGARGYTRLRKQLRDSADSIYANIAEGNGRSTRDDTLRFLSTAWASLREFEAHVERARGTTLLPVECAGELRQRSRWVGRLLWSLLRHHRGR